MIGVAVDGRAVGGIIHKPFSNETIWSWRKQRSDLLGHLHILDEVEQNNRTYHDHEGPRLVNCVLFFTHKPIIELKSEEAQI